MPPSNHPKMVFRKHTEKNRLNVVSCELTPNVHLIIEKGRALPRQLDSKTSILHSDINVRALSEMCDTSPLVLD